MGGATGDTKAAPSQESLHACAYEGRAQPSGCPSWNSLSMHDFMFDLVSKDCPAGS